MLAARRLDVLGAIGASRDGRRQLGHNVLLMDVAPAPRTDHQRNGRPAWRLPPPLNDAQRAALAAALEADEPPQGLYPPARYNVRSGPSHLSGDRIRTEPLPMPPG